MKSVVAPRRSISIVLCLAVSVSTGFAQENEAVVEDAAVAVEEVEVEVEVEVEEVAEDLDWAVPVADSETLRMRAAVQLECAMLRRACELTADQEKTLGQVDDRWVDKVRKGQGMKGNAAPAVGLVARFFGANPRVAAQPVTKAMFERELKKVINQLLTDEQKLRYEAETRSRDEFRGEAIAAAIVEVFYEPLGLSDEQAEKVKESIKPWAARSNIRMSVYFSNPQYFPDVPEHLLQVHFNIDQLKLYRRMNRRLFTDENFNDGQAPIVIER